MSAQLSSRFASWSSAARAAAALSVLALTATPQTVYAQRRDSCSIGATPLVFGRVTGGSVSATGTIEAICNGGGRFNPFSMALSSGSGTFVSRTMLGGKDTLRYNLYTDAAHTKIWGDGSAGTSTVTGNFDLSGSGPQVFDETVFGLVPAQTLPPPGVYSDVIVVTLIF